MGGMRVVRIILIGFTALVLLYLIMPTFVIVPLSFSNKSYLSFPPPGWSFKWYTRLSERIEYPLALYNSLRVGIPVSILATIFGTLAALGVVRGTSKLGKPLSPLIMAPLMLPQIILAIGTFPVMAKLGILGTRMAVIIGHTVICIPLVFITVTASLRMYRPTIEIAAMTLGANWWQTFWYVTFPVIRLGVFVGAILSFTFSFDELIIALFLSLPTTRTLPLLLWEELRYSMTPIIAAATTLVLCLSAVLLLTAGILQRKASKTMGKSQ